METINIHLYSIDELSESAKERAVAEHAEFLEMINEDCSGGTSYRVEEIINSIRINEYLFFADGRLAPITHYTGKHKKAGITELRLNGEVYTLSKYAK